MIKVFIDGSAGTTGLRIREMLGKREDISLIALPEQLRKDVAARRDAINGADAVFLCLPDDAAREAVGLVDNENTVVIDASTAHRTSPGWAYGFPELSASHRAAIVNGKRIANPGCYASGFLALVYPLVAAGVLPKDYPLVCHAVSGYSGAGKKGIAEYEAENRPESYDTPRLYALTLSHKHLPEMQAVSGLAAPPVFCPIVDDYYSGMEVTVPLRMDLLPGVAPAQIAQALAGYYAGERQFTVHPLGQLPADGMLAAGALQGSDRMELYCTASPDGSQMLLISLFDNLGKGSSGAAVQCMNLMLGLEETAGLE